MICNIILYDINKEKSYNEFINEINIESFNCKKKLLL